MAWLHGFMGHNTCIWTLCFHAISFSLITLAFLNSGFSPLSHGLCNQIFYLSRQIKLLLTYNPLLGEFGQLLFKWVHVHHESNH